MIRFFKDFFTVIVISFFICLSPTFSADFQKGLQAAQKKDYETAFKEWLPLANSGHISAQTNMGVLYAKGLGVPKDYDKAASWYKLAADKGDAYALTNLGVMYVTGQGVEQNNVTAYAWWNIATTNGNQKVKKGLSQLAEKMTPAQIAKAEELVKEMVEKNPKLLNK